MHGPTSHLYYSLRLRLHYVDWGNDGAPHLLLIHGGRDHCRNWDWVAERLRDRYHIVAPDLRGHGDSDWASGGGYGDLNYVSDIAALVHQKRMAPVTIIGHSLGGSLAILYSGLFPETVAKVVAIEGLGPAPRMLERFKGMKFDERVRSWIVGRRENAGRSKRKYATPEDAVKRMKDENAHLNNEQARHLTLHGTIQNEDGSYSWKFDNLVRMGPGPSNMSADDQHQIWSCVTAPTLLVRGMESWASDPSADGRMRFFQNARLANIDGAGHWVHHDQLDAFLRQVDQFLAK
jgi:pimeloyl-ACP methyl ester carboxylesterase